MYYIYFLRVAKSKIYHIDIIFFVFSCFLWLFSGSFSKNLPESGSEPGSDKIKGLS